MRVRIATTLSMRWRVWPLGCAVTPVHVASIKSAVHAWATLGCWATGRPRVLLIKGPATCSVHEGWWARGSCGAGGAGFVGQRVGHGLLGRRRRRRGGSCDGFEFYVLSFELLVLRF